MTADSVLAEYESRLRETERFWAKRNTESTVARTALLVSAMVFLLVGMEAARRRVPVWWPAVPVAAAALAGRAYSRSRAAQTRTWRLKRFLDQAVQRAKGAWVGCGFAGEEFDTGSHLYASDLGVFGEGSLFEFLDITRTAIGRRGLANYLLQPPGLAETLARQDAVRELEGRADLRQRIAVLGEYGFSEARWGTFAAWLDAPPVRFSRGVRVAMACTSAMLLAVLAGAAAEGGYGSALWIPFTEAGAVLMALHGAVGLIYRSRVRRVLEHSWPLSGETATVRDGLEILGSEHFHSSKLAGLAELARSATKPIGKLQRLLRALDERNKDWIYPASLPLLAGTQLAMAVAQWRVAHGEDLRSWLEAWGEFEALNALGSYAHESPDSTYPEFVESGPRFEAAALGHPLLPNRSCVRNDVRLGPETGFCVVSGSNMSGKSTLLRAIGSNAVLASAGAPVRARSLRLSRMTLCTSLSVVDSLLNHKSKFLAEVERLRQMITAAPGGIPVLFLIDEIFSGTNSRDRRVAAEAVVRTLIAGGAIGAVSTHDMSLTEIADKLGGENVHMGSRNGSDPMDFDYLLKPGPTTESNALAIARMAGVPL